MNIEHDEIVVQDVFDDVLKQAQEKLQPRGIGVSLQS